MNNHTIHKIDCIWIAAAHITYERYKNGKINTDEDLYIKQSVIIKDAEEIYGGEIPSPMASTHALACHDVSSYNYLNQGYNALSTYRRITYKGEFDNNKETPEFSEQNLNYLSQQNIPIKDILVFRENEYTELVKKLSLPHCNEIIDFLNKYHDAEYQKPDNELSPYYQIMTAAQSAVNEFDNISDECSKNSRLIKGTKSRWLNGANNKVRNYLWQQLKLPGYEHNPVSISLTAEVPSQASTARFRISVQIKYDDATEADNVHFNHILDEPLHMEKGLVYFASLSDTDFGHITNEPIDIIKEKLNSGEYRRVQISYVLGHIHSLDSKDILQKFSEGIEALLPYYKLALKGIEPEKDKSSSEHNKTQNARIEGNHMDKNTILYGPPGTGKTYNTVNYAVAAIEDKDISQIQNENHSEILKRYNHYKDEGQINFITFHQSYGYEEFIEGIRPAIDNNVGELEYTMHDGIFKDFCKRASEESVSDLPYGITDDSVIWKVSLCSAQSNPIKDDCFENSRIRLDWDIQDDITSVQGAKSCLANLKYDMQVGDIVLSLKDRKTIDAIGVIDNTGYKYLSDETDYKHSRGVRWLCTNISESIYDINEKHLLNIITIHKLPRLKVNDILKIAQKYDTSIGNISIKANDQKYVFIIDEINRGNISKIFGELITLIECSKRLGSEEELRVKLPYSGDEFGVPQNVYILGTMNTADRSIALIDTALRRRFGFIEMMPQPSLLLNNGIDDVNGIDIPLMLETINKRIEILYDREHTIGHAFFMRLASNNSIKTLADIFKKSIIPLLQEYFYEDYSKIQYILGDNSKPDSYKFILDEQLKLTEIFNGKLDIDLPKTNYRIQVSAFDSPESYIGIYEQDV